MAEVECSNGSGTGTVGVQECGWKQGQMSWGARVRTLVGTGESHGQGRATSAGEIWCKCGY